MAEKVKKAESPVAGARDEKAPAVQRPGRGIDTGSIPQGFHPVKRKRRFWGRILFDLPLTGGHLARIGWRNALREAFAAIFAREGGKR